MTKKRDPKPIVEAVIPVEASTPLAQEADRAQYSFPTRSRCPRCGSSQTRALSSQEQIQYRVCIIPTCRHHYKAAGRCL